jgi:ABC-type taurine transport system ATPase subunit
LEVKFLNLATLLPWTALQDNVEVALKFRGVPAAQRHERAAE